ncbi:MAG: hypothetical protein HY553_06405 [Elusimicrobia bacterium]|nr:hypothetical protein [Elusimicrobiota bacterium]
MDDSSIVRDSRFREVSEGRLDSKRRIGLGKIKHPAAYYRVYENEAGQIILDPQVVLPAAEAWLYSQKAALASVRRGLKQAAEGKARKLPSLAKHAGDRLE